MPAKPLRFVGDSRDRLKAMSKLMQYRAGGELWLAQEGKEPNDFKPMPRVGAGAFEIRIRDDAGIARVFYVAKFPEAVYVLHCFEKKSEQTAERDMALGQARYKDMIKGRGQ
jgi:phage-related protein